MTRLSPWRGRLVVFLMAWLATTQVSAKVAYFSFQELVQASDVIVVAEVKSITKPLIGKRHAKARVLDVWKGAPPGIIEFLASPSWTCDISTAKKGETVVLFLVKRAKGRGYAIAYSGRGRMPLRDLERGHCAEFWEEVRFPKDTQILDNPDPKSSWIRYIGVGTLQDLVQRAVGRTTNAQNPVFFPPGVFDSNPKQHQFREDWYGKNLKAMGEAPLPPVATAGGTNHIYRFTCLPSFAEPFCITIKVMQDGRGKAVLKEASGMGGYGPGALMLTRDRVLPKSKVDSFLKLLEQQDYWHLAPTEKRMGLDGSEWIVEAVRGAQYHVVDRWTPDAATPIGVIGLYFLKLGPRLSP